MLMEQSIRKFKCNNLAVNHDSFEKNNTCPYPFGRGNPGTTRIHLFNRYLKLIVHWTGKSERKKGRNKTDIR